MSVCVDVSDTDEVTLRITDNNILNLAELFSDSADVEAFTNLLKKAKGRLTTVSAYISSVMVDRNEIRQVYVDNFIDDDNLSEHPAYEAGYCDATRVQKAELEEKLFRASLLIHRLEKLANNFGEAPALTRQDIAQILDLIKHG